MAREQGSLRQRLDADYLSAMKAKDPARISTLRMVRAALQAAEKAKKQALSDDEVLDVVVRETKVRRESMTEFERGGRTDLASAEAEALRILDEYTPAQLSETELREIIAAAVSKLGPDELRNARSAMGSVMREVMPLVRGRANGAAVNEAVRAELETFTESTV